MTKTLAIQLVNVTKSFGSHKVLASINLKLSQGQSLCLCGKNAQGKTTLIKTVAGLLKPDRGQIIINGHNSVTGQDSQQNKIGLLANDSMLYGHMTIMENLSFYANLYGIKNVKKTIEPIIESMGLPAVQNQLVENSSRGTVQKAAIARAMINEPKILLADEPFAGLDAKAQLELIEIIKTFNNHGGTSIVTTHNVALTVNCCDKIAVINKGEIIHESKTSEIDINNFVESYMP